MSSLTDTLFTFANLLRTPSWVLCLMLCAVSAQAEAQTEPAPEPEPEPESAPETEPETATVPATAPAPAPAAAPAPATAPAPAPAPAPADSGVQITGTPGKGLTVKVSDAFSMNLRARIQVRYQLDAPPKDASGDRELEQIVGIGTARLYVSGNIIVPELTYMLQLAVAQRDFRDGATSPIYDAYLDYKPHRDFNVRAGQFFVAFDRLRTVREWALQMADRPRPIQELTLDRDVGAQLYSERFLGDKSPIAWYASVFGGGGTNLRASKEPGALFVGRIELRPFGAFDDDREGDLERREKPGLLIGGGVAANLNTDRVRSTTGATYVGGTFDYLHAAGDLMFKLHGFAFEGEYVWRKASDDSVVSTADDGTALTEYSQSGQGWVVQASYVFDPPIEVVARTSRMYALAGTDPAWQANLDATGQELGVGLNYYFNAHWLKLQADWIARMPSGFEVDKAAHVVHVQLDATF